MAKFIQVVTTVDSREGAEKIAETVVDTRLAACVQISECRSMYRWQGSIENSGEFVCVMKSRVDLFAALDQAVRQVHPYEVPELLATEIFTGNSDYLAWLDGELLPAQSR